MARLNQDRGMNRIGVSYALASAAMWMVLRAFLLFRANVLLKCAVHPAWSKWREHPTRGAG
jgi:hypothetical protein